jgi:RNA polymerase sigma factor (sigma-70 family)
MGNSWKTDGNGKVLRDEEGRAIKVMAQTYPSHPLFEAYCQQYERLLWRWAHKLARKARIRSEEVIGYLYLRMNRFLYAYKEELGYKFSTYFLSHVVPDFFRDVMQYESESWAIWYKMRGPGNDEEDTPTIQYYNSYEADGLFFKCPPPDDDWADEILKLFDTREDLWDFLMRGIDRRVREILEMRYKLDMTLAAIGRQWGLSRERVRQLEVRGLMRIKDRLVPLEKWAALFKAPSEVEEVRDAAIREREEATKGESVPHVGVAV